MARANFFQINETDDVRSFKLNSAQTIAPGDPVVLSSGRVSIAATTSEAILGICQETVTSSTEDDDVRVNISPDTIYSCSTSGTLSQGQLGVNCDIDGSTGAFYVDENSTTYGVCNIIAAPDGLGATAVVHVKFVKMSYGEQIGPIATGDIEDSAVTADKIAAAALGDGLAGGAGTALKVDVSEFAGTNLEDDGSENLRISASAAGNGLAGGAAAVLSVQSDTTTGGNVAGVAVGANGVGVTVDGTTLENSTNTVRVAATCAGNGLTGGGAAALAAQSDTTTGANVAGVAVGANGIGVTVDGTTLENNTNTLRIAASAAGNGLTGGAAAALAVSPDVTTGAAVAALTVGANGAGMTVDTTTIEHNANSLRLAAQGHGIAGGAGATLSVDPDATTGATVCPVAVVADGVGTTLDNDTLTHTTGTLQVGDNSLDQTQLANIASGGAGVTFLVWQHMEAAATVAIFDGVFPVKARLIDCWTIQNAATATNITVDDGTNPIVDLFAGGGADKAIVRGAEIDDATFELAVNATLRVISSGAQNFDLFCTFMRVA